MIVDFPLLPPPRGDHRLFRALCDGLHRWDGSVLQWVSLRSRHYQHWTGVQLRGLGWTARPWVFDIVDDTSLISDPLAIKVRRDIVIVEVADPTRVGVRGRLIADRPGHVDSVDIPAQVWPPAPWTVDVNVGWSTQMLSHSIEHWIAVNIGRNDLLLTPTTFDDEHDVETKPLTQPRVEVVSPGDSPVVMSGSMLATGEAFDRLATLDLIDSAVICSVLEAFAEALGVNH